jgi:flagellar M-ring protein FliF
MADWQDQLSRLQTRAAKLPKMVWAVGGILIVSAGFAGWLEMSGPPYSVLEEGLSPADGGKVIAELQKLGIPYQLQADGDVILVPAPELAQARLQLGQQQVPGSDAENAWSQVENAPMTASDLAQSTMATQALELSLQQSIGAMAGIKSAQVFVAVPPETPFLADQPKPSASVIIGASDGAAQAQGAAIANMVAGAVPGLTANHVTVETTNGVAVYPQSGATSTAAQLATATDVENAASARVADLLTPLVGVGNFQTGVTADIDFTQTHTHEVTYGPGHIIEHQLSDMSSQTGSQVSALGIPGAMSNEPPSATTANPAPVPSQVTAAQPQNGQTTPTAGQQATTQNSSQQTPQQSSNKQDQTYVTDESESDITKPDWVVKSLAVSVILNKAALGSVTPAQVQAAIAGAFSYPTVTVNVLAAPFQRQGVQTPGGLFGESMNDLTHSALELFAAAFILFGIAMPLSRRLAAVDIQSILLPPLPPPPPPLIHQRIALPAPRDITPLRDQVNENTGGVAKLLQGWVDDTEGHG